MAHLARLSVTLVIKLAQHQPVSSHVRRMATGRVTWRVLGKCACHPAWSIRPRYVKDRRGTPVRTIAKTATLHLPRLMYAPRGTNSLEVSAFLKFARRGERSPTQTEPMPARVLVRLACRARTSAMPSLPRGASICAPQLVPSVVAHVWSTQLSVTPSPRYLRSTRTSCV